jgi:hypothetical protein
MTVPEIALRLQLELDSDAFEEILVLIAVVNEAVDELDLIALRIKVQPHHKGEKLPAAAALMAAFKLDNHTERPVFFQYNPLSPAG